MTNVGNIIMNRFLFYMSILTTGASMVGVFYGRFLPLALSIALLSMLAYERYAHRVKKGIFYKHVFNRMFTSVDQDGCFEFTFEDRNGSKLILECRHLSFKDSSYNDEELELRCIMVLECRAENRNGEDVFVEEMEDFIGRYEIRMK